MPPLATVSVPVIVERVVVATQEGIPLARTRVKPFVEAASLEREFVPPA